MNKAVQALALLLFLAVQLHAPVHQLSHLPGAEHHHQELGSSGNSADSQNCHHCSHGAALAASLAFAPREILHNPSLANSFAPHLQPRLWRSQQAQGPPAFS